MLLLVVLVVVDGDREPLRALLGGEKEESHG
jgi:hypothetical protein